MTAMEEAEEETRLFQNTKGGAVSYNNWRRRVWGPALAAAGLDHFHPRLAPTTYAASISPSSWREG